MNMSSYQSFNYKNKTNFVPTPRDIARTLLSMAMKHVHLDICDAILDPCAGANALLEDEHTYPHILYDIEPRDERVLCQDYLSLEKPPHYKLAICNPPFNLKKKFIDKLLSHCSYVALVAPYKWTMRYYGYNIIDCWHRFSDNTGFSNIGTTIALFILTSERQPVKYVDKSITKTSVLLSKRIYREDYGKYPDDAYAVYATRRNDKYAMAQWRDIKAMDKSCLLAYVTPYKWAAINVLLELKTYTKEEMIEMLETVSGGGAKVFFTPGIATLPYIPVRSKVDCYPEASKVIVTETNKLLADDGSSFKKYIDALSGKRPYTVIISRDYNCLSWLPCLPYSEKLKDYLDSIDYSDERVKYAARLSITMQRANLVFNPLDFRC